MIYKCSECQREFKSAQGLAGHQQFKHAGQLAQLVGKHAQHNGSAAIAAQGAAEQLAAEQLEQLVLACLSMLEEVQLRLERLEQLVAASPVNDHHHGDGCQACQELRTEAAKLLMRYPGMWAAKAYADEAVENNGKYPAGPMIQAWNDVPAVKQALDEYRLMNAKITIVG